MKLLSIFLVCCLCVSGLVSAGEIIGVSEPAHLVDLSLPEAGIIGKVEVEEGQSVEKGQILSSLDNRVLEAQLRIAVLRAGSSARMKSAEAARQMRQRRLTQIEELASGGSANEDELAKARADFVTAEAEVLLANEEAEERKLEAAQLEASIAQRILRSPFDGVVTRVYREVGENVSPGDALVLSVAQLDTLEIVIYIQPDIAAALRTGQQVPVSALPEGGEGVATVAFVSPVTDSSSGTTRVRLTLANSQNRHRSGVKYRVQLPNPGDEGKL
jgi:RND family efflux transporter MFP subunit